MKLHHFGPVAVAGLIVVAASHNPVCAAEAAKPAAPAAGKPAAAKPAVKTDEALEKLVIDHYARLVYAGYSDALKGAQKLNEAVDAFVSSPSGKTLKDARDAWIAARVDYSPTEAFRFYGGPIDDANGPEGLVNGWPLDEAYIDYVEGDKGAGIVNHPTEFPKITKEAMAEWNEKGGEQNIATGYHAIEFLLWGQDLFDDGPGRRAATDYAKSGGAPNADRRGQYLKLCAELLVDNLQTVVDAWSPEKADNYRAKFLAAPAKDSIQKMFTGIGILAGIELSGERMSVAFQTQEREDEHSCFSDNTRADLLGNAQGIRNVYLGDYKNLKGPGLTDLVKAAKPDVDEKLRDFIEHSVDAMKSIPEPFEQAIQGDDDTKGRKAVKESIMALEDVSLYSIKSALAIGVSINLEAGGEGGSPAPKQ